MTSALFVVSEEGYWAEECVEPLTTLETDGIDVTVATPSGDEPVVDERSLDPDEVGEETAEKARETIDSHPELNDPIPLAEADADEYDAVVFPGGHGTEWDVNQDRHTRQLLVRTVAGDDGVALVVCHAVGILGFAREASSGARSLDERTASEASREPGSFLVDGRQVTGFPNEWEEGIVDEYDRMPDGRKLPYFVEDEVTAAGGEWDAELDADESVTVDGDLITARGPGSSAAAAETLVDALGD